MNFRIYSHRHAEAIINSDEALKKRYEEFVGALKSITDAELIEDFEKKKAEHASRKTGFKSLTPSINDILKKRMLDIPGWKAEVGIFNDVTGEIYNTEWRLDFACDDTFCVEVAFNHGEAIAWNLLKPVLSCELNHVEKAIQGKVGIYVCATDKMKVAANIDSSSGSFEKVLRYLPPMMNQLTIPMIIIGLEPSETFKISENADIVTGDFTIDETLKDKKVAITEKDDFGIYKGVVTSIDSTDPMDVVIEVQRTKNNRRQFQERMIRFLEIIN